MYVLHIPLRHIVHFLHLFRMHRVPVVFESGCFRNLSTRVWLQRQRQGVKIRFRVITSSSQKRENKEFLFLGKIKQNKSTIHDHIHIRRVRMGNPRLGKLICRPRKYKGEEKKKEKKSFDCRRLRPTFLTFSFVDRAVSGGGWIDYLPALLMARIMSAWACSSNSC